MDPIRIGIIGTGGMGSYHFSILKTVENAAVTAVCDINPKALEKFKQYPEIQCFTNADEFFEKSNVQAVLVSTPHYFHHELGAKALAHGKHVLVEKPVAVHKALVQKLIDASNAHPELKCAAMFNMRTIPVNQNLRNLIQSGELGTLRRFCWTITDWFRTQAYYNSGDWRASWRGEGGGVLLNQCPHQLDLLQWFFGMPKRIHANAYFGKYHDIEVEDEVTAFLEYEGGLTGLFIASTGEAPGSNRLEIAGDRGKLIYEKGVITFERTEVSVAEFCKTHNRGYDKPPTWSVTIPADANPADQHKKIHLNFLDAIAGKAELVAHASEGIREVEIGNAMLLSAWTGKTVDLPMDAALFESLLNERIATSRYQKNSIESKKEEPLSSSFQK